MGTTGQATTKASDGRQLCGCGQPSRFQTCALAAITQSADSGSADCDVSKHPDPRAQRSNKAGGLYEGRYARGGPFCWIFCRSWDSRAPDKRLTRSEWRIPRDPSLGENPIAHCAAEQQARKRRGMDPSRKNPFSYFAPAEQTRRAAPFPRMRIEN